MVASLGCVLVGASASMKAGKGMRVVALGRRSRMTLGDLGPIFLLGGGSVDDGHLWSADISTGAEVV